MWPLMKATKVRMAFAGLILVMLAAQTGWGLTADLSGIIEDKSGGVVPNAAVSVVNEDTGIIRLTTTNGQGTYSVPILNPGFYKVTVSAQGFQPLARTGIVLNVGDRFALDFVLDVGRISTEVTVTAETAPMWQTATSVGTVINHQFVDALPLNGLSFQSLILITPGVSFITASSLELGSSASTANGVLQTTSQSMA